MTESKRWDSGFFVQLAEKEKKLAENIAFVIIF